MAGNGKFNITSSSPDLGFNGSKANIVGPSTTDSRLSVIGKVPLLSQSMILDPIVMADQKYTRSGELKRVLGFSAGICSEENTFGAAHSRPPPPLAFDELKHYKDSVTDSTTKAGFRAKKLDEHLNKLNKYVEVVNSKKQTKITPPSNERPSTLNLKMGVQNLPEVIPQKLEDRTKNMPINKRLRTSIAETRQAEHRTNGVARQSLIIEKDRDLQKSNSPSSDLIEGKVQRLPAGGEGWDKKIKRKRSAGTSLPRPLERDGELKGPLHHKIISESVLQSGNALGFRSGHANNINGTNKLDDSTLPANSLSQPTQKRDLGKANLMRDFPTGLNKSKPPAKGNNGLNVRENNQIASPSPMKKLKAFRTPRGSSGATPNSSLSNSPVVQNRENPLMTNKNISVGTANIHKRALPTGSSSTMAQWVGQRPQKISRTRRANLVSPVSNLKEGNNNITSEGCSPSDLNNIINSGATSGSLFSRGTANGPQHIIIKNENISSPAQISGGEEPGACVSVFKEKVVASDTVDEKAVGSDHDSGPSLFVTKNNKLIPKEEKNDGIRRKGRTGRGSFTMANVSPIREKLDNTVTTNPKPGGEKNGSKAGRPPKRQLDRKGFPRRGPNSSSSDLMGESDDDREELLAAAISARNASVQACSSSFWKNFEPIFGPASLLEAAYSSLQVDLGNKENFQYDGIGGIRLQNQIEPNESARMVEFAGQFQEFDDFCVKIDSEILLNKMAPLCQRVLSALILEDEIEKLEENFMEKIAYGQYTNDVNCDSGPGEWDEIEYEYGSAFGAQSGNRIFPCNGINKSNRNSFLLNPAQNGFSHSEVGVFVDHFDNDFGETQIVKRNGFTVSSFESQYEKMVLEDKLLLELQSIGIHIDTVPDLDEGENEALNQEIILLKQGLRDQVSRKKACLESVCKSVQQVEEADTRKIETVAMDKLVESAHRKLLATQGSIASKYGIAKVSKQVALSFSKRIIAKCKAFEEKGTSCFNEPAIKDALFAVSSLGNVIEATDFYGARLGSRLKTTDQNIHSRGLVDAFEKYAYKSNEAFAKSGPISNKGRKKEVLLNNVGAKRKRSERERENNIPKVGRPSLSNSRGERKPKLKPKQNISPPGNGFLTTFSEIKHQKREECLVSHGTISNNNDLSKDNQEEDEELLDFSALPLPDFDTLDSFNANDGLEGNQDLNSLLNFDDVGLLDHDSAGLEVPMDDLSELSMFT